MKLTLLAAMLSSAAAFAPAQQAKTTTSLAASELKHGRIAMMAMLGTFVHNNGWTFDGYLSPSNNLKFSDIDSGIGGLFQVPAAGLLQILIVFGLVELAWWPASDLSGDYGVRLGTLNDWEEQPAKYIR